MIQFIYQYEDTVNYNFSTAFVSFSSSLSNVRLLNKADEYKTNNNADFFADFSSTSSINWGQSTNTDITLYNGADISSGILDLTGSTDAYADINSDNLTAFNQGTVRILWTPDYTGNPAANQYFFAQNPVAGNGNKNKLEIYHSKTDVFTLRIYNNANSVIVLQNLETFAVSSGVTYELELNYDIPNNQYHWFRDGAYITTKAQTAGSRSTSSTDYSSLRFGYNSNDNTFTVGAIVQYNTMQHSTADYTPDWSNIPILSYSTEQLIAGTPGAATIGFCNFQASYTNSTTDNVKFQMVKDSVPFYWNGSSWAASDGSYAQSSFSSDISTNIPTFSTERKTTKINAVLYSEGNTTPVLDYAGFCYYAGGETEDDVNICTVQSFIKQITNDDCTNEVKVRLVPAIVKYKNHITVCSQWHTVTPSSGVYSINLIETENMPDYAYYLFRVNGVEYKRKIPNQATAEFWSLEEYTGF